MAYFIYLIQDQNNQKIQMPKTTTNVLLSNVYRLYFLLVFGSELHYLNLEKEIVQRNCLNLITSGFLKISDQEVQRCKCWFETEAHLVTRVHILFETFWVECIMMSSSLIRLFISFKVLIVRTIIEYIFLNSVTNVHKLAQ